MIQVGTKVVFGIPSKVCPIMGLPIGIRKYVFRNNKVAKVYVRNEYGISSHIIKDNGDNTWGLIPQGANIRMNGQ